MGIYIAPLPDIYSGALSVLAHMILKVIMNKHITSVRKPENNKLNESTAAGPRTHMELANGFC